MLATFCFDLSRKLKYICLALRRTLAGCREPAFARRILQDNEFINPGPGSLSWEEMAIRAEEVMKGLWREIQQEHFEENSERDRSEGGSIGEPNSCVLGPRRVRLP